MRISAPNPIIAGPIMAGFLLAMCLPMAARADDRQQQIRQSVDAAIGPVMQKYGIPGMAVGISLDGRHYLVSSGVAAKQGGKPVDENTIFEVGSISKTFTATLATYAEVKGDLKLTDRIARYVPELDGNTFGGIEIFHLGTHTPGGFPLQVPDEVKNERQLMRYFAEWEPTFAPGSHRNYANPSVGMLGVVAARAMKGDFATLVEKQVFGGLGLSSTYVNVPKARMADYAQGHRKNDQPVRVDDTGMLADEAYGVKTTASDLLRFADANMGQVEIDKDLQQALDATRAAYFKAGPMTQDLVWEQYDYPAKLDALLEGNSTTMSRNPVPVKAITPPQKPRRDVFVNKTGSTNGFGAYVAFVPEKRFGIVILANKFYPNDERIRLAHAIMKQLGL
ncbi:class C beta-lactamase [Phyllobacterium sp. 21LDTY02-6]|uniref:class C beta-lactamase n=1 Tax=Phyllobacterium sp. 21LDTY02-6 TaxID=2944903 RepID=UPI00208E9D18|nr:class C beta-lactamase [Phyllobacterium sp. 21LDTY02-6]